MPGQETGMLPLVTPLAAARRLCVHGGCNCNSPEFSLSHRHAGVASLGHRVRDGVASVQSHLRVAAEFQSLEFDVHL